VLEEYALFPMLSRLILGLHQGAKKPMAKEVILSRHAWRRRHPLLALAYGLERLKISNRARRYKDVFLKKIP
jgi:hypothetical protein